MYNTVERYSVAVSIENQDKEKEYKSQGGGIRA
jgi:hypothetical protein